MHPTFVVLTLNPSPKAGEGLSIRLPFSLFGRRGWGMRANLQNWDELIPRDVLVLAYPGFISVN
jgi:hypothetical protein